MINHIQLLRNIGLFDSVNAAAAIDLKRLTLVYAENARGKTTLAAILRSLGTNDPIPIAERKRLAAANLPHVVLDCDGGPPSAVFQNNAWNRALNNLVVFDDLFVDQNVYSGLAVDSAHRQNLHELILGAQGVALNQQLQQLIAKIETHNGELRAKGSAIPAAERGTLSVDDFCALPAQADIDKAIQAAERALAAANQQNLIRNTPTFETLSLPTFDAVAIDAILQQDLPALDKAAAALVQRHLTGIGPGGEAWAADGMRRLPPAAPGGAPGACPFCAQDLLASPIISHYRAYFSAEYASLKRTVADALAANNRAHGDEVPVAFERAVRVTTERRQFWSRFCDLPQVVLDTAGITRDWRTAREAIAAALTAKQAQPLERFTLPAEAHAAVAAYEAHRQTVGALNSQLQQANAELLKIKAGTGNPIALAADLARLRAVKARYTAAINALCQAYLDERNAKRNTEQLRDNARIALDNYRAKVFPTYQTMINQYLVRFNAGFRIESMAPANTRAGPTCTYSVVINNTAVPVESAVVAPGEPSFRNTLSAGDRNTLALAFFFASLQQDAAIANKIVVIDDPMTSLDENRSLTTVQTIRRLSQHVQQVIVLSHSKFFLCQIWENSDTATRCALQVVRDATGSTIETWNVTADCITEYDRRHAVLREYVANGSPMPRQVAEAIRPVLEGFLRVACPEHFTPGTLLGQFRNAVKPLIGTPWQVMDVPKIQELEELTEYANRFHHDSNLAAAMAVVNDGELQGFVRRTLAFTR